MKLAGPGERFMLVGKGLRNGLTGTAIDFASPAWEGLCVRVTGLDEAPHMWCDFDSLPPAERLPADPGVIGLDYPHPGAHLVPQRYLMRIDPDDDIRRETDADITSEEGAPA